MACEIPQQHVVGEGVNGATEEREAVSESRSQ